MKIAILTSGILPVPAVQGGAVENLVDFYLAYNEQHHLHDITVYSVWHPDVDKHPALKSEVNHYQYIHVDGAWAKLRKSLFMMTHRKKTYYHRSIAFFLHEAMKDIHRQQYDVVILENRPAYALELKKVTGARLVYHLHNDNLSNRVPQYQEIYDRADRILTVSNYIKGRVLTIHAQDTKTRVVHNGIDLQAFAGQANQHEGFVLVFSGRVTQEKGILPLIEAMRLLQDRKDIRLLVVGSSFYGNTDNRNAFAQTLKEKAEPLKDRITFTGFIPYDQMPNFLHTADVAVIPSIWDDPFPTTVLEAMAAGVPIISTRRGGIPEEVTEETAILLDTDDHFTEKLTKAILDLYEHPEKRRQMSEAALKHSLLFNKGTYAKNFFQAIEGIN